MEKNDRLSFPKRLRLSKASEYRQVFDNNFPIGDACLTMLVRSRPGTNSRLGFAVARKQIKKSVLRNWIKRVIRESFRINQHRLPDRDMVIIVRRPILLLDGRELNNKLEKHWNNVIKKCEIF